MDAKLVVVGGDAKPTEIQLKLPVVVGRGRDAGLTLPHALVSRKHCEILESDGYLVVRDLGSLNGTFINKKRIREAVLPPGELLTLGTVTFRAVYDAGSGTAEEPVTAPGEELVAEVDDAEALEVEEVEEAVEFDEFEIVDVTDEDATTEVVELEPDEQTSSTPRPAKGKPAKSPLDDDDDDDDDAEDFANFLDGLE